MSILKGLAKKALPIAGAAIGSFVGAPQVGAALGSMASKAIPSDKPKAGGASATSSVKELPQSASSLPMARSQDKARMKRSYGYPSSGGE